MVNTFIFSPSGTTAKIAGAIASGLGTERITLDLTLAEVGDVKLNADDVAVFAMPVYAGRIPALAAERIQSVKGNGQKAVAVAVYGNRDYDDALIELCDIVSARGFEVVAAAAFIARHCIFPKVANGRPDAEDINKIAEFTTLVIKSKLQKGSTLGISLVKGNRPYRKPGAVPLHPEVDKKKCNECGTCAAQCPVGAIDPENPTKTDNSKCITCCRCINVCPQEARHFGGLLYKMAGMKFVKDNSRRLEPEWFI